LWIYLGRFPSTERDGTSVFACWKTLMLVHVDTQNLMMLPMTKEASEKHSSRVRLKCMSARTMVLMQVRFRRLSLAFVCHRHS
jgi:hypothetical protein